MVYENGQPEIVPNLQLFAEEGQPDPDPDKVVSEEAAEGGEPATHDVDGTSYTNDQIKEALEYHKNAELDENWQKTNTQEAERIAIARKNLVETQQLEEFLTNNPDAKEKLQKTMDEHLQTMQAPEKQTIDPVTEKRLTASEQRVEDWVAKQELRQDISDLHTNHKEEMAADPDLERKIVQFGYENGIADLEHAFKIMRYDDTATKKLEEGQKIATEAHKRSGDLSVPGGTKSAPAKYKGHSPQELTEAMMKSSYLNDES